MCSAVWRVCVCVCAPYSLNQSSFRNFALFSVLGLGGAAAISVEGVDFCQVVVVEGFVACVCNLH